MENEQCDAASGVNGPAMSALDGNGFNRDDSTTNGVVCEPSKNSKGNEVNKLSEVVRNLHSVPYIYRQDVVRSNKSGATGIVSEVAGDSDSDSSITDEEHDDDDDDDDDDEDGEEDGEDEEGNNNFKENGSASRESDTYKCGSLQADQVRVLWMDDTEPVHNIRDVTVVDRGFLHGDYVAAASDPTGQVGVVVDVNLSVDLLAPDGSFVKDVSSRNLQRVRDFTVGDHVVLGPWLGRINDVYDNVTVLFDDGSLCKVTKAEPLRLRPTLKNTIEDDGHFPYYPGQRVRAASSSVFKNSRWLSGLWRANRLEGTVTKVTAGTVFIYWIASAGYGPDSSTPPAEEQSPKNLKLLSCFTHSNWQVGDWCLLPSLAKTSPIPLDNGLSRLQLNDSVKSELDPDQIVSGRDLEEIAVEDSNENDESMDLDLVTAPDEKNETTANKVSLESSSCNHSSSVSKDTGHEPWPVHRKKIRKVVIKRDKKARKKEENFEKALLIVNTRTQVDVVWQDGTIERGVDATTLIPIDSPGDHEFVPEQYVVEKAADDGDDSCEARRVGVVKTVNAKERTACVRWLKPVSRAEDPREFDREEIVSVYELEGHNDYDYCYGDVVVRLSPVSVTVQAANGVFVEESENQIGPDEGKKDLEKHSGSKEVEDALGHEGCTDFTDLSWVGNITGLKNGDIEVTWADGMVSMVGPQAIYVVGRDDDDESIAAGSDETALHDITGMSSEAEESIENGSGRNTALSLPLAALGFVARLASGIFSRGRKNVDPVCLDARVENEFPSQEIKESCGERDSGNESSSHKSDVIDNRGLTTSHGKHELVDVEAPEFSDAVQSLGEESGKLACYMDDSFSFKRFDIAKDPLDHYFLGASEQNNNARRWLKKIQQDWSILQNNLPDGIYVRVYEDRMDLLRAVIVGAYGTPYQDGLFFFDFHLPPTYPDVPPSAYYHSGGWRINPNLYEEGNVCLSLLNTWTGRGNEVWDPASSSILQVLVSLQGLVLNSKPYFNEAGYDKQVGTAEGEKNSLAYNENTFLLNCKTMMYLMRKPPKDFEDLVKEHFRRRGYHILKACDAYMKGYLIGSLTKDASVIDNSNANSTSVGFKLMLAKIVRKLFLALNDIGADCHEFKHLQQS
ncbi:probable ubiquitin-conjugating enzyme E2 23 isoform X2 [Mangifera indica]|uniref:probable ubiquitin-conjugating enzyme E2 23 isoform X2 n=1 Tax=Mangifera indica TaxID=29780 RepID=UPI001CFB3F5F|nr:probable ubiquitin-conjugating enzyme E2 23 isoform X2 [Mangifera indica]